MQSSNGNDLVVSTSAGNSTTVAPTSGSISTPVSGSVLGGGNGIPSTLPPAPGLPHPSVTAAANISNLAEDICTLVVIGLPEDMLEREFQNMFTFCLGFESATIKTPTVPNQEEPATAPTTTTTTTAAATNTADTATNTNGTASPPPSSPSSSSSAGNDQTTETPKKLRVGLAKFRGRLSALEARKVLHGRLVDPQSGATLKVELAKKNHHMKRLSLANNNSFELSTMMAGPQSAGVSSQTGLGFPFLADRSVSSTSVNVSQRFQPTTASESAAFNAFYSVPSASGSLGNEMMRKDYSSNNGYDFFGDAFKSPADNSRLPLPDLPVVHGGSRSLSFSHSPSPSRGVGDNDGQDTFSPSTSFGPTTGPPNSTGSARNGSEGFSMLSRSNSTSATGRTFFGREITTRSITTGGGDHVHVGNGMTTSFRSNHGGNGNGNGSNEDQLGPLNGRLSQLSINTQLGSLYNAGGPNIGPLSAPAITAPRNPIPADQNPPCNTLYVGNLPVNAQEDELRRLFMRQRGYKRLCFRPKPGTGPMCFVEFDDIACATHAMNELYGTPLSNSVKGGIRLSYSKNPLGVRQTPAQQHQQQQQVQSTFQHQQQQQQQQLQQMRQAHLAPFSAGASGHPQLSLAQQQQLAQMKAATSASAMKQRLENGGGNGSNGTGSVNIGPGRLSLAGLSGMNMTPPTSSTSIGSSGNNSNGNGSSHGTPNNPNNNTSSPMQEATSFHWLMEAL